MWSTRDSRGDLQGRCRHCPVGETAETSEPRAGEVIAAGRAEGGVLRYSHRRRRAETALDGRCPRVPQVVAREAGGRRGAREPRGRGGRLGLESRDESRGLQSRGPQSRGLQSRGPQPRGVGRVGVEGDEVGLAVAVERHERRATAETGAAAFGAAPEEQAFGAPPTDAAMVLAAFAVDRAIEGSAASTSTCSTPFRTPRNADSGRSSTRPRSIGWMPRDFSSTRRGST